MKLTTKALAAVLSLAMAITAQAVQINGAISFAGPATLDGGTVAAATGINFQPGAIVTASSGNYGAVTLGTGATFNDFTFDPAFIAPVPTLWNFTFGGLTFSMTATALTEVTRDLGPGLPVLTVKGVGMASITGFEDTPGQWSVAVTEAGTTFGFASSAIVSPVPDNGGTVALLGVSLLGVALVSRRLGSSSLVKA